MEIFAFDFDGVVCDSSDETAHTAWRAARELWPQTFEGDIDSTFLERFRRCRPVIETGFELLPLVGLLQSGVTENEILLNFERLCSEWIARWGSSPEELREVVGDVRDRWIEHDLDGWLAMHGFYSGVTEAINAMHSERCIITTKPHRFTVLLAEKAGLEVTECVFGLEAIARGGKRSVIEKLLSERTVHFFEDRLATLKELKDLKGVKLYLADWGYNTQTERREADSDDTITLLDPGAFKQVLRGGG